MQENQRAERNSYEIGAWEIIQKKAMPQKHCEYDGCTNGAFYEFEWWGVNQNREDPIIIDTAYVCTTFGHMVNVGDHEKIGHPDEIHRISDEEPLGDLLFNISLGIDEESSLPPEKVICYHPAQKLLF